MLGKKVTAAKALKNSVKLSLAPASGEGEEESLTADRALVAIGRRPHTQGLGLKRSAWRWTARAGLKPMRISKPILTVFTPLAM